MNTTNSFVITGRLTADAEVTKLTNSNKANIRIAVNSKKDDNTTTAFISLEGFNKDEKAFDTLKKGQLVKFNGFFRADEWEDKEGKKQNKLVFVTTSWEKHEYEKKEAK